jgi:hypothetical protein
VRVNLQRLLEEETSHGLQKKKNSYTRLVKEEEVEEEEEEATEKDLTQGRGEPSAFLLSV